MSRAVAEGIFLAEKEPEVLADADGILSQAPQDVLIIREGLLRRIWFYFEDNKPVFLLSTNFNL